MPKGVMVVMSEPVAGMEDEFNDWYDNVHLPEFLKVHGIAAAQRFVAVPSASGQLPAQRYLAVYEFDSDVQEVLEALRHRTPSEPSPALDRSSIVLHTYSAIGERVEA